ncbi:MAG: hypothetical protein J7J61_03670 [Candidatus Hydrothermae bacterium]|nr:hypothetical protein [Candidatus Hydrothermae bacterium]
MTVIVRKKERDMDELAKISECMAIIKQIVEDEYQIEFNKLINKSVLIKVSRRRDDGTCEIVEEYRHLKDYAEYIHKALQLLQERGEIEIIDL